MKFKVGDKVKITQNTSCHEFKIGDEVLVVKATLYNSDGDDLEEYTCSDGTSEWFIEDTEAELVVPFKIGDRVMIASTSVYFPEDSYNNPRIEGTIKEVLNIKVLPLRVKWGNGSDNSYDFEDLELVTSDIKTNTKTNTVMQTKKDLVLATAKRLAKANNTVTTLEIKVDLRKNEPEYFWNQELVSEAMDEFAQNGDFVYTDNGTYRTYTDPLLGTAGQLTTSVVTKNKVGRPVGSTKKAIAAKAFAQGTLVKQVLGTVIGTTRQRVGTAKGQIKSTTAAIFMGTPTKISMKKALEIMENLGGQFATAYFTKQDGTDRLINFQYLKGQDLSLGYVKVKETGKLKTDPTDAIRQINIQTLKLLRAKGQNYKIK